MGIKLGTEADKSAFISSMTVVYVPLLQGAIKGTLKEQKWTSIVLAVVGIAFLELEGGIEGFQLADVWSFLQPVGFGTSLLLIENLARKTGGTNNNNNNKNNNNIASDAQKNNNDNEMIETGISGSGPVSGPGSGGAASSVGLGQGQGVTVLGMEKEQKSEHDLAQNKKQAIAGLRALGLSLMCTSWALYDGQVRTSICICLYVHMSIYSILLTS